MSLSKPTLVFIVIVILLLCISFFPGVPLELKAILLVMTLIAYGAITVANILSGRIEEDARAAAAMRGNDIESKLDEIIKRLEERETNPVTSTVPQDYIDALNAQKEE